MTDIYPFIKWVGGKTQLMESVFNEFPKIMLNYYEPFIGGGSVLFNLLNKLDKTEIIVNNIYISDINKDLIDLYLSVKNNYKQLIKSLSSVFPQANFLKYNLQPLKNYSCPIVFIN